MADCKTCKESRQVIPAMVHDADMERQQQDKRRLWVIIIILIVALLATNGGWIYYESQFEDVSETTTTESYEASSEGDGVAVVNGDGEVHIG